MSPRLAPTRGRRADVLRLLQGAAASWGVVEVAGELDLHPNTARFHLQNLEADGLVERDRSAERSAQRTPGRPPLRYRAVRGMDATGPRSYDVLAQVLLDTLDGGEDSRRRAVEAGRRSGRARASRRTDGSAEPVGRLVDLMDDLGFAPEQRRVAGEVRIDLRHCPFLEMARDRPEVVCPVHLGLMQGALESWDAPVTVGRLDPFVEPDRCVAHLTAAANRGGGTG